MKDGNKTDNGVLEIGTDECRLSYQVDTPGQSVDEYLETVNKVINEKKNKQKKSFNQVFQNPLKGFPYNEDIDSIMPPLEEGKYQKYSDLLIKKAKLVAQGPIASKEVEAVNKQISAEMKKLGVKESQNPFDATTLKDKDGKKLYDTGIKEGTASRQIAKMTGTREKAVQQFIDSNDLQGEKLLQKIKKNKKLAKDFAMALSGKPGNKLVKQFTEALELEEAKNAKFLELKFRDKNEAIKAYKTVNEKIFPGGTQPFEDFVQEGSYLQFDNVQDVKGVLNALKKGGLKFKIEVQESLEEGKMGELLLDIQQGATAKELAKNWPISIAQAKEFLKDYYSQKKGPRKESVNEMKLNQIKSKFRSQIAKFQKGGDLDSKAEKELLGWAYDKGEIATDDADDADDWLMTNVADKRVFNKLKEEDIQESKPKRGSGNVKKPSGKMVAFNEGPMDGSKLTGAEISAYFRRHPVRDKQVKKAVEFALDHGGAMSYAIKGIEKMKRGLSKHKDVKKALNIANYGTESRVESVGFMFKEDSPIAGNMQVEGDQYIPQKKGVNKNIANYWNKEIKGLKPKELEAIQSMYMITDHNGVVQMYKAGKRDFIKSIKESNGKLTRTTNEAKGSGNMYLEIRFNNRNEAYKAMNDVIGGEQYQSRASEIENEKETIQFFDVDSKEILKMLRKERKMPKFKVVTDEKM